MRLKSVFVSLAAAALLLNGCFDGNSLTDKLSLMLAGSSAGKPTGSLVLNLTYSDTGTSNLMSMGGSYVINDILPPIDMTPVSYDIEGTGPYGATFSLNNVTQNSAAINSLVAGAWAISVTARNTEGVAIASGSTAVAVVACQTAQAEVTVRPLSGTGSFVLSLSWPENTVNVPSVTGVLTSRSGQQTPLTITMGSDNFSASYANSSLAAGYYTLSMKISDGGNLVWGRIESVRIVAGVTTTGSIVLMAADMNPANEGNVAITVGADMENPIEITFTGQTASIVQGADMTVTAATSEPVDGYQWYLNGDPITGATASSITIGSALSAANYRLDLVVTKGEVMSANGFGFSVTPGGAGNNGEAQWAQTVTAGSSDSLFHSVLVAQDGLVYAAGYISGTATYNFGNNVTATGTTSSFNIILVKYNSSGAAQWARSVTAGNSDSEFFSISVATDGSIYAAGSVSGTGTFNFGNNVTATGTINGNNVVLVKYNSSGIAQWAKTITAGVYSSQFYSISVATDSSVYAAGYILGTGTYNFGNNVIANGTSSSLNIVLVKYNSSGVAQWARTVTAGNSDSQFSGVSVASDGSIYAAGYISGTGTYNFGNSVTAAGGSYGAYNAVLVKYNSAGVAQWAQTTMTGSYPSSFGSVFVTPDGSVVASGYIVGSVSNNFGNDVSATGTNSSGPNVVLVKYNSSGIAQWAQTVTAGNGISAFFGVSGAPDGSVFAAGVISGTGIYSFGDNVSATGTNGSGFGYNVVLVKYNSSGVAQWTQTVTAGSSDSAFSGVSVASDGSVYAAGEISGTGTYSFGNNVTATGTNSSGMGTNVVLVKYK